MAEEATKPAVKKVNLRDHYSIKRVLDETVSEIVVRRGYVENHTVSNIKMVLGVVACGVALVAQFYPKKFPENKPILVLCILAYVFLNMAIQLVVHLVEKNHILFTYPLRGSFSGTGLAISSKLPRYSDLYTIRIASADPKHIAARAPVELTKSVTGWIAEDGTFVEAFFWEDMQKLLQEYEREPRKTK